MIEDYLSSIDSVTIGDFAGDGLILINFPKNSLASLSKGLIFINVTLPFALKQVTYL